MKTPRAARPRLAGAPPGQHVDVRLTGEDGYQAQRSYSIASAPEARHLALTVERIEDGEVSPYLVDEVRPATGSSCAVRSAATSCGRRRLGGPLFLVAGGSGVVPAHGHAAPSGGGREQRAGGAALLVADHRGRHLSRGAGPAGGDGRRAEGRAHADARPAVGLDRADARRIDRAMLAEAGFPASARPRIFICGPTRLVESAGQLAAGSRPRARPGQDRAVRADERLELPATRSTGAERRPDRTIHEEGRATS